MMRRSKNAGWKTGMAAWKGGSTRVIALACTAMTAWGQQQSITAQKPTGFIFTRPYKAASVPPIRTGNSMRLRDLMRGGKIYLTVQDAVALALENNIDLEIDRYNPLIGVWNIERAEAGGRATRRTERHHASSPGSQRTGRSRKPASSRRDRRGQQLIHQQHSGSLHYPDRLNRSRIRSGGSEYCVVQPRFDAVGKHASDRHA